MPSMQAMPDHATPSFFRVISANLQHGRLAQKRPNAWSCLLGELGADVVCAQESRHPHDYGVGASLQPLFRAVNGVHWGSAVLAADGDLADLHLELDAALASVVGGVLRGAEIGGAPREVEVYSVHILGKSASQYRKHTSAVFESIARGPRPRIVAGDFNITVSRRTEEEALKNTRAELELLDRIGQDFGLVNAWEHMHPVEPLAQTLRWSGNSEAAYHCDAVFVSKELLPYVRAAHVHAAPTWLGFTDHNAVVVDFAR
jgi:hypothetical protein